MQPPAIPNRRDPDGRPTFHPERRSELQQSNRLALIGASVRAAAESAERAGFEVIGIDRFADQDTLAVCKRHILIGKTSANLRSQPEKTRMQIAAIAESTPLISVGGLAGHVKWLDPEAFFQPWPTQRSATRQVRILDLLRRIVSGTRFSLPTTIVPHDTATESNSKSRWLLKRGGSCGGLGTRWIERESTQTEGSLESEEMIQEWVAGRPFGATLLSNGADVMLLGVCRSMFTGKGPFPFVYCGSFGPLVVSDSIQESLVEIGRRLVAATGLRGLFNIDYVKNRSGRLWLLEINPRWSGSSELIERHLRQFDAETSMMAMMVDGMNGSPFARMHVAARVSRSDTRYTKRIVFARRDLRFDLSGITRRLRVNESVHDAPATGQFIGRGEPVCTLITRLNGDEKNPMHRHRALVNRVAMGC